VIQTLSDWQKGIIIPIHKSAAIYDLNNYRGITLTSNVYKIYASITENTIMSFLEDKNVLGESQGAFRKNRRLDDLVREVIMISPPNFRNSFGIPSRPAALPDFNETRAR
jgi:hypothetical protein